MITNKSSLTVSFFPIHFFTGVSMKYLNRHTRTALTASFLAAYTSMAAAQGGPLHNPDAYLWAQNGQIYSASWNDSTDEIVDPTARVFGADFGEDPSFPYAAEEPGFGSNIFGSTLTVNILSGLSIWNGTAFQSTSAAVITGEYGGASGNSLDGGGFSFFVSPGFDLHPSYFISGNEGAAADIGVYLLSLNASAAGLATSQTFWFVFNLGKSEEEHDAAIEWANTNLVPAPAALLVLASGIPLGLRSGRRRRGG